LNSSDPQEGELWVNVRNIPITALNPVERAEGTPAPTSNWEAYGGLRSIYTVLSNSFAYGPQKRRKVKNGYKLFYQNRVSRAGKSSVPRRRHLNVFNKATTINSSTWRFWLKRKEVLESLAFHGTLPTSIIIHYKSMGFKKQRACKLTFDHRPMVLN
jgi:hypothetical protein